MSTRSVVGGESERAPSRATAGRAAGGGAPLAEAERLLDDAAEELAAFSASVSEALARGVEHVHVERTDDGWRLRHRDDESLSERRLTISDRLPTALLRLAERADASGIGAIGRAIVLTCRVEGTRQLVELRRTGTVIGEDFLMTLHGNALGAPRLDALGPDVRELRAIRELVARPSGWLAIGSGSVLAGERLVRALAQELVSPERKLLCLEPAVHPPLAGITQISDERELGLEGAIDVDAVLLAATPSDERLAVLAARAAEQLLVVQRCTARRPSTVLRRLLALGLSPSWIAHVCPAVLMHHRVHLVCRRCRVRVTPEESHWLDAIEAPPVRDVAAWLERSLESRFREGEGCASCHGTGRGGTLDLVDVVVPDEATREALVAGETNVALTRIDAGGTLAKRLAELASRGDVSLDETARHLAYRREGP